MIVCLCTGTSEREIRQAVAAGAASLADLGEACDAGQDCGMCRSDLLEMLHRESCGDCPRRHNLGAVSPVDSCARN